MGRTFSRDTMSSVLRSLLCLASTLTACPDLSGDFCEPCVVDGWPVWSGCGEISSIVHLSLSGKDLHSLPSGLASFASLQTLHVQDNSLSHLPAADLASLNSLQSLHVHSNQLYCLPAELASLPLHTIVVDASFAC